MSVFITKAFSTYLSIIFYLSICEGDLCHSGVIAGDLERRHKGEESLGDCHYENVPRSHQLCPPLGRGTVSLSLCGRTQHQCTPGTATTTTKICVSANCFETGSWEDGPRVCTALDVLCTSSQLFGKGREGPQVLNWCRAGTPQ